MKSTAQQLTHLYVHVVALLTIATAYWDAREYLWLLEDLDMPCVTCGGNIATHMLGSSVAQW